MCSNVIVVVFLITGQACALEKNQAKNMMRRDAMAVQLDAVGDVQDFSKPVARYAKETRQHQPACNDGYKHGPEKTNVCGGTTTTVITAMADCMAAALNSSGCADRSCLGSPFEYCEACDLAIKVDKQSKRPRYCFFDSQNKWYWNSIGYDSDQLEHADADGTPVCLQAEFINGTAGAAGTQNSDCGHPDYQPITGEQDCRDMAGCTNMVQPSLFKTSSMLVNGGSVDANIQFRVPKGCYMDSTTNPASAHFNDPTATDPWPGTNGPSDGQFAGTPLCKRITA